MEEFIFGTGRVASCLEALRRPQNQFSLRARTSWRFRTCRKTGITLVSELDDNSDALICLSCCCLFQSIFKNSSLLALCNSRMWRFQRAGYRVCLVSGHVTGWLIPGIRSWLTDFCLILVHLKSLLKIKPGGHLFLGFHTGLRKFLESSLVLLVWSLTQF